MKNQLTEHQQTPERDEQPRLAPELVLAIGVAVASSSSILIRFAQPQVASLVIAAYRMALASLLLLPILLIRYRGELRRLRPEIALSIGLAGLFLAVHFATWISSLEYTSVASSVVLVQTMPLFVALLSPLLLKERVGAWLLAGLAIALLGTLAVGLSDACDGLRCPELAQSLAGPALKGDALAIAGALGGAGYVMLGRRVRPRVALIPYVALAYLAAALALGMAAAGSGSPLSGFPPINWLWILLLALGPQLLAHSSYNWALRYLPAAVVSLTLLGEPVGATVLAYLLLDEQPPLLRLVGGGLILVGIGLASGLNRPRRPTSLTV